jgi:hypothetical protein
MALIKSLEEIKINQYDFPIFFWNNWLISMNTNVTKTFIYYNEKQGAIVPFKVNKLKLLKKADYLYIPYDIAGKELEADSEKHFIEEFHNFLKKEKICDAIFPPTHFCNFKSIPAEVMYFKLGIIVLNIGGKEDDIFNKMTSNYRNEIRKALKSNVKTSFDNELLNEFHSLYSIPHKLQKIRYEPIEYFENLRNAFSKNIHVGVSYKDDSAETAIFNIYDKINAYYFYAGATEKTMTPGSNKLLLWDSIKHFTSLGISKYVLGGYREPKLTDKKHNGIQNFKLRFGAEIVNGYHFIKIFNPIKFRLFSIALKIKTIIYGKEFSFINKSGLEIKKSK